MKILIFIMINMVSYIYNLKTVKSSFGYFVTLYWINLNTYKGSHIYISVTVKPYCIYRIQYSYSKYNK